MAEENNDVTSTADQSEKVDWIKVLNILHEFLPEDFPEFRTEGEEDRVKTELEIVLYTEPGGVVKLAPTLRGLEVISIQYRLLATFAKNFSGDPNEPFYFANLPFVFVAKKFVEQYASKLTRHQMRKILKTFQMKESTLESYIKKFSDDFKLDSVDQFIADFKAYIRQEAHRERYEFPFSEIIDVSQTSVEELGRVNTI